MAEFDRLSGTSGCDGVLPGLESTLPFGLVIRCKKEMSLRSKMSCHDVVIVGLVGYALGGLPGERLLKRLGIKSSDDTVLRRVKTRGRGAIQPAVRVLSVDDWAWRKKQRYGTMLLDLERSQVIDFLPVRSADSFAQWLGLHPDVEVITRDRSGLYADGGRQGAPSAVQITDRYYLVSNLSETVERDIQQLQVDARKQLAQSETREPWKDK